MSGRSLFRGEQPITVAASTLAILILAGGTARLAGPLWSGALFLLRPAPLPASGGNARPARALHKGHVDISTGLYIREDDDFVVDGGVPLVLRRTYLSGDRISRPFGIGATHTGEWYLRGDATNFSWAELILADGGRITFNRETPGNSFATARFRHAATPTEFYGAELGWVGSEWAMRFTDGRIAIFKSCGPAAHDVCSLVEMRYPGGGSIAYVRDLSGRLTAIRTGNRAISLEYDDTGRIARGRESSGRAVTYGYDSSGRLDRVTTSDGVQRRYTYSDRDEMLSIDEPAWRIENTFADGRLVKQVTHTDDPDPYTLEFAYTIVDGKVAANDVTEDDGTHTVYRFSDSHYVLSEVWDARGGHPISIAYDRRDNVSMAMTIRCWTPDGQVIRNAPTGAGWDDSVKRGVIARECRRN